MMAPHKGPVSRVKKYKAFYENYTRLPKNIRTSIVKNADSDFTKSVCEICQNIVNGNLETGNNTNKVQLKKKLKIIKALADKKKSLKKKVKYIRQKGGFILPLLSSIVAPILGTLISNAITR